MRRERASSKAGRITMTRTDTDRHPELGRVLDERYELVEQVGSGGMATVYRGRDRRLGGREVAVKILHRHLAERADSRARFKYEADAAARLEHKNILKVYDASDAGSRESYIVMEFVHGRTLASLVDERAFRVPELGALIAHQVAEAVAHAHKARILHRDIKPENIMVSADGAVKLMDFGIARALDEAHLTLTGALMGSPAHMAPEQIEGKTLDFRADVFALGTVLYYLSTGVLPFTAPTPHAVLRRVLKGDYEPAQRVQPAVGRELSGIIDKALAPSPDDRWQSAESLRDALASYLAKLGLESPVAELQAWIRDRERYETTLSERLVARLFVLAEEAVRQRKRPAALDCLDRVLALDSGNTRAMQWVNQLTRQRNRLRWAVWSAVAAVLVATTAAVYSMAQRDRWRERAESPPVSVSVSNPAETFSAFDQSARTIRVRAEPDRANDEPRALHARREREGDRLVRRAEERAAVGVPRKPDGPEAKVVGAIRPGAPKAQTPQAPRPEEPVRVTIFAYPPPVVVSVNGEVVHGIPRKLELRPGKHEVVLEHPSCEPCRRTTRSIQVVAGKPEQSFRFAIELAPAELIVQTNVPASVWANERVLGSSGDRLSVPVDSPDGKGLTVRVESPGFASAVREVTLVPGKLKTLRLTLTPGG
jgi:serine/threonine-protein kinase